MVLSLENTCAFFLEIFQTLTIQWQQWKEITAPKTQYNFDLFQELSLQVKSISPSKSQNY